MLRMAFSYSALRGALEGGYALCAVSYEALHFERKEDADTRLYRQVRIRVRAFEWGKWNLFLAAEPPRKNLGGFIIFDRRTTAPNS